MRRISRHVLAPVITALLLAPALVAAQVAVPSVLVNTPPAWLPVVARARAVLQDSIRASGVPGASIAVMVDGRVIWSEGFGWADLEQRVPVTPLTRFRIGSVSKSLTAAAIGLLWQEGRLDLDAPVQRYVPSFPRKRWPITTRQVAGHQAGIRHYRGTEFLSTRHYDSVTEGLSIFSGDSLLFEPGTQYSYSSYGFNLVSAVVEGASGQSFLDYMQEHVFIPLGMRSTVPEFPDSLIPWRARFYTEADSGQGLLNVPLVDNSYKWAGGGFLSTAEDLVRYGSAYLQPGFLQPRTRTLLFTAQHTRDGADTHYSLGWFISHDSTGRLAVSHGGGSVGGTAYLVMYPGQGLVVALLANGDMPFVTTARDLARVFLDRP